MKPNKLLSVVNANLPASFLRFKMILSPKKRSLFLACLNLFSLLLTAIYLLTALNDLMTHAYSWDLDHAMYYGQRLLHGELLYTKEYYDKLPFYQYLFAIPAFMGSVKYFILFNIGMTIFSAISLFKFSESILTQSFNHVSDRHEVLVVSKLSVALFLGITSSTEGGLSLNNTTSITLMACALSILYFAKKSQLSIGFWLSALLAAIAISIRPYLLPSILSASAIFCFLIPFTNNYSIDSLKTVKNPAYFLLAKAIQSNKNIFIHWVMTLVLLFLVINSSAYVYMGSTRFLIDGIIHNSQDLQNSDFLSILKYQFKSLIDYKLFGLSLAFSILTGFAALYRLTTLAKLNFLSLDLGLVAAGIVAPLSLEFIISSKWFWPHYFSLFTLYISLSLSLWLYNFRLQSKVRRIFLANCAAIVSSTALFSLSCLTLREKVYKCFQDFVNPPAHRDFLIYTEIKNYFRDNPSLIGASFLAPDSMYVHWRSVQSRHGFQHSADFYAAKVGNLLGYTHKPLNRFDVDANSICQHLNLNGPDLIFLSRLEHPELNKCLRLRQSSYAVVKYVPIRLEGFCIYKRIGIENALEGPRLPRNNGPAITVQC